MQPTLRKTIENKSKVKEKIKEETPSSSKKLPDEKLKRTVSTPRINYVQKSSTADIYNTQKKKNAVQSGRAHKEIAGTSNVSSNITPMKNYLRSSPSSVSQISTRSSKHEPKTIRSFRSNEAKVLPDSARTTTKVARKLPFSNITVNSPVAKRKLNKNDESKKEVVNVEKNLERARTKELDTASRQRSNTRTLDESEIKILTPDVVDNNAEMLNLKSKLVAKSKAFYVELENEPNKIKNEKSSDNDVSYEDDFESYESDFDSYHSEDGSSEGDGLDRSAQNAHQNGGEGSATRDEHKEKDEESMLDSGSFDLRESQRSAQRTKPAALEFIVEGFEDAADKKPSLTDEGFQDMSSSSAVSSMKTVHVDAVERPMFIDFQRSNENRRKKKIFQKMQQRAKDILSMVTLHEMSYTLFEMKPIPYDLYMVTFGRSNYIQVAVQTFDDGITEEVQTEEVACENKWTQHPVEFTDHDIVYDVESLKQTHHESEDYLTKLTLSLNRKSDTELKSDTEIDQNYKLNPLRAYFEQKDGAGPAKMLPYEKYRSKLENNNFDVHRLRRFLKKVESRINQVLSGNTGNTVSNDLKKCSKFPLSNGYVSITSKNIVNENVSFLKQMRIVKILYSDNKSNLIMTVHKKPSQGVVADKCIVCLWDLSVAIREPVRLLVAIDNINVARFRGGTDGIFIAALEDGSIHLWDLAEEPTWHIDVATNEKTTNLVEINSDSLSVTERDREWNLKNSQIDCVESAPRCTFQACAYTSSANGMHRTDEVDVVVGLDFVGDACATVEHDGGRKIVGQIGALHRAGIITLWSIVQDKSKSSSKDIGKAFSAKMMLERTHVLSLVEHIDIPASKLSENQSAASFNLNAAKRRISCRKNEKRIIKRMLSRQKSAGSSNFEFDIDRPSSAASTKNRIELQPARNPPNNWESGVVCADFKVMRINRIDHYLVAKNCGEVLVCTRTGGDVKINKVGIATDTSSVTCVEISPHGLPYFLAATDSGTVNLCSLLDLRVLLTLDCRNGAPEPTERYQADAKGRYVGSVAVHSSGAGAEAQFKMSVGSVAWCAPDPCRLVACASAGACVWQLARSDIRARPLAAEAGAGAGAEAEAEAEAGALKACAAPPHGDTVALLTSDGEVQIHHLSNEHADVDRLELFKRYVALL